jgi:metal-dependent hydrolase (beta-lactamase superfamily II)
VETAGQTLLFDTGARGDILLGNMERLGIDAVLISHGHWDHIGGLADFLRLHPAHCTQHIEDIKRRYPGKYLAAGAGQVVAV